MDHLSELTKLILSGHIVIRGVGKEIAIVGPFFRFVGIDTKQTIERAVEFYSSCKKPITTDEPKTITCTDQSSS